MKKGCLASVVLFVALAGGYFYLLQPRFSPPADRIGALVGASLTFLALGLLNNARFGYRDYRLVRQSLAGARTPADGRLAAAVGPILPLGAPLKAPFTGRDCVLYDYEMQGPGRGDQKASNVIAGFGLTPSAIRTAMLGDVKLLGYPNLDGFEKEELDDPEARTRARGYIASTSFENMQGLNLARMYGELKDFLTDDDGAVRKDWRMADDLDPEGEGRSLRELIVAPGEPVCVVGIFSAARHGLVPDVARKGSVNRMTRGDGAQALRSLRAGARGALVGGLLLLGVGNAAVWGILTRREDSLGPQKAEALRTAARDGDVRAVERLLARGAPLDGRDLDGRTALFLASTGEVAVVLVARGADVNAARPDGQTPLMEAAAAGRADVVRALVAGRAILDARHPGWGTTAIMQAEDAGHEEVVEILRAAGASDTTVTARNGTAIDEASAPFQVVAAYLKAVQAADVPALERLSRLPGDHPFRGVDFTIWRGARPVEPALVSGFASGSAATVVVRGVTGAGFDATWVYHLAREGQDWRVVRERWQTP